MDRVNTEGGNRIELVENGQLLALQEMLAGTQEKLQPTGIPTFWQFLLMHWSLQWISTGLSLVKSVCRSPSPGNLPFGRQLRVVA
ncbi:MAG: hypothetical protein JO011_15530 [Ktedonobacteraceae bacterium]|nr:hypothetical protein [Verrucomicrobiota bacterium]MBV9712316.1 hypothetical protein [Ktedonobacteraceae bacterium]